MDWTILCWLLAGLIVIAGLAGTGAWLGMVVATAAKLAIAFLMIGMVIFKLSLTQLA